MGRSCECEMACELGHHGVERTLQDLQKHYWFRRMRRFVENYNQSCVECAYYKIKGSRKEGELYPIEKIPIPFYTVHIDHLGPFPLVKNKEAYVIVLVDGFTKYCIMKSVKNTTTSPVIKFMTETMEIFGAPTQIVSDRGTAYTSRSFEEFWEDAPR